MPAEDLKLFADKQINIFAQRILDKGDSSDKFAAGELEFYMALRSVLSGTAERKELGLLDAINDTLQHLGKVESGVTFYK